jgi:ABC-type nitrate/sulfonate/bicarbonate transport system permease component
MKAEKNSERTSKWLLAAIPIVVLIAAWETVARTGFLNRSLFPAPSEVVTAFVSMLRSGELVKDILATLGRAIAGFVLGSALGVVGGILSARIRLVDEMFGQLIHLLRPIPPIALVPLAVVWLGLGEISKIGVITWGVFFPVWVNTYVGVSGVEKDLVWAARSLGAGQRRLLFGVVLPAALRHVVAGMRVAVSVAFICVVVSEMIGSYVGLGYRINTSYLVFRVDRMLVGLIALGALGAFSDWAFVHLVKRIMPWYGMNERT